MKHINSHTLHIAPNPNTTWPDIRACYRTVYSRSPTFSPTHPATAVLRYLIQPSSPTHSVYQPNYISPHIKCFLTFSALQSQHIKPVLTHQHHMYIYPLTAKAFALEDFRFHSFQISQHINHCLPTNVHFPLSQYPHNQPHFSNSNSQTSVKVFLHYAND
jgi:hypothetical protein